MDHYFVSRLTTHLELAFLYKTPEIQNVLVENFPEGVDIQNMKAFRWFAIRNNLQVFMYKINNVIIDTKCTVCGLHCSGNILCKDCKDLYLKNIRFCTLARGTCDCKESGCCERCILVLSGISLTVANRLGLTFGRQPMPRGEEQKKWYFTWTAFFDWIFDAFRHLNHMNTYGNAIMSQQAQNAQNSFT